MGAESWPSSYLIGREYTIEFVGVDGVCGIEFARDSGLISPTGEDRLYGWFAWRRPLPRGRDRDTLSHTQLRPAGVRFPRADDGGRAARQLAFWWSQTLDRFRALLATDGPAAAPAAVVRKHAGPPRACPPRASLVGPMSGVWLRHPCQPR